MQTLHFIGDSLIEYFNWQKRFPAYKVINSGWAGETVSELLHRTNHLTHLQPSPDWLIIMIGTNNVAMQDFSFLANYEEIVDGFKIALPSSKILIHGLFPIELPWLGDIAINSINEMIESLALKKEVGYLNGCNIFTKKNKNVRYFLEDGVHISENGYALWADAIEHHIT